MAAVSPSEPAQNLDQVDAEANRIAGSDLLKTAGPAAASWTEVLSAVWASLKVSAVHVNNMDLQTLALGWWPVMQCHSTLEDHMSGEPVRNSADLSRLLHYAHWAHAAYQDINDRSTLVASLGIQEQDLLSVVLGAGTPGAPASNKLPLSSASRPQLPPPPSQAPQAPPPRSSAQTDQAAHLPAYYVAVEHASRAVLLVVRGTSALRDLVTDLCAHTHPFLTGYAHWGMAQAAQTITHMELERLSKALADNPGYQLLVVGHSLGGGVASLIAMLLSGTPELSSRLGAGTRVSAITYAAPPVVTEDLAKQFAQSITSVVNQYDMIVRTSVASISDLARELEAARDKAVQTSQVAAVASELLNNVRGQSVQSVMSAGLRMLGTSVLTAVKESTRPTGQTAPDTLSSAPSQQQGTVTTGAAAVVAVRGEVVSTAKAQVSATQSASATGMVTSLFKSLSTRVVEEVTKARAEAVAGAVSHPAQSAGQVASTRTQQPSAATSTPSGWQNLRLLGGHLLNQLDANSQGQGAGGAGAAAPVPQGAGRAGVGREAPSTAPQSAGPHASAEEEQRLHRLCNPGNLILLKQQGLTGQGQKLLPTYSMSGYQALRCMESDRPSRLLLKRSMLSDHYLASYIAALKTLTEEAVLEEARTSNPLYNRAQDIL